MVRLEMKKYDINRKTAKISELSSGKIDKNDFLTSEEILPSDQSIIIEQAKFTYSPLGSAFEKRIKTVEEQGKKQVKTLEGLKSEENHETEAIEGLFPKKIRNNKIKNETDEIKKWEEKIKQKDLML